MTPGHIAFVVWTLAVFGAGCWIGAYLCRQAMILEAQRMRSEMSQKHTREV